MFEADDTLTFSGLNYMWACRQRDAFEAGCWNVGIVPVRGPTLSATIQADATKLTNAYRFADLAGQQTQTALFWGWAIATKFRAMRQLGL